MGCRSALTSPVTTVVLTRILSDRERCGRLTSCARGSQELADDLDEMVGDACGERGVLMTDLNQKFVFMNNQRIYRTSAISGFR